MKKERTEAQKLGTYLGKMRLAWRQSPMYWEAYKRAQVDTGLIKCEKCGDVVHYRMIEVDHIVPVVSVDGPRDIQQEVFRMNCPASGLQVLCLEKCHRGKSKKENAARRKKGI